MRSIFDVEPEHEPGVLTPERMRAQLGSAAAHRPEDVYGVGLPKEHVKAVLGGNAKPRPELLAILELRPVDGGYVSTVEEEPEPPYIPPWPNGKPFTLADEAAVVDCVREAFGAAAAAGDSELGRHYDLSRVLLHSIVAAGAMRSIHAHDAEHSVLAFLAGAIWERRARKKPGSDLAPCRLLLGSLCITFLSPSSFSDCASAPTRVAPLSGMV